MNAAITHHLNKNMQIEVFLIYYSAYSEHRVNTVNSSHNELNI